jgi:hypothetical protein
MDVESTLDLRTVITRRKSAPVARAGCGCDAAVPGVIVNWDSILTKIPVSWEV